ncbi:MAG TPA: hypothetical protein VFP81_00465 [Propionibacteriaceae bacterium]|nr:hypothetical protein [Propionibacteriaceae bacterium]
MAPNSASQSASPGEPITLHMLAGSEVKDMAGVVEEAARATNVRLTFEFIGTLDGSQAVADGKAAGKYDAIWFPSNRYLSMIPRGEQAAGRIDQDHGLAGGARCAAASRPRARLG